MTTSFRFGSTIDPCRTAAAERAVLQEVGKEPHLDPDTLLQCPFDKNHLIRVCRFPYHLIKCRKNHPKLASELKTCPYNARHLVPQNQLMSHTETCEDRISVDIEDRGSTNRLIPLQVSTWVNPDMSEDWDHEVDDAAPPFVWGVNTVMDHQYEMKPTNNLGPSFRTPNTLPWAEL
ncbi:hypothetical protein CesoFtcFv8_011979 [Champsocephalus esox]|uniref:CHHC U11-48K-type domain-containing protein n=1 Tax=Champsocephalus esox TaxID=159716 RepID=A0AAN8GXA8_9TELE|nr:hypothetical protein CesoFtcFv8_011979 [Champsocephalus esox]